MNLNKLVTKDENKNTAAIPTFSLFFYFAKNAVSIAESISEAIEKYISRVGFNNLQQYVGSNGYWRNMTEKKYRKDLSLLQEFPNDLVGTVIEYNSGQGGVPGPYGVFVYIRNLETSRIELETNLLRLDFPTMVVEPEDIEDSYRFYLDLLEGIPFQSSNAGFAFKRTGGSEQYATRGVNRKIKRYFGFDPCYADVKDRLRGFVFTTHWINAINNELLERIGGEERISQELSCAKTKSIRTGLVIRGAKFPPIGDINHGAKDRGCLPEVARLLAQLRSPIRALGEPGSDAQAWLARFDEMDNTEWENVSD